MEKKQFAVLGLGVFGSTVSKTLASYGMEIIAVDHDPECVQRISDFVTRGIVGDVTDQEFLRNIGIGDVNVGIVAIGDHFEESVLAVLNLKELGVPYIVAKAKNKRFMSVLSRVGADLVIRPEKEMGEKLARNLLRHNIKDLIDIDEDYSVVEMAVPKEWAGKTLLQLDLRHLYGVNMLGRRNHTTGKIDFVLNPREVLVENDIYLMLAKTKEIEKFDYLK